MSGEKFVHKAIACNLLLADQSTPCTVGTNPDHWVSEGEYSNAEKKEEPDR